MTPPPPYAVILTGFALEINPALHVNETIGITSTLTRPGVGAAGDDYRIAGGGRVDACLDGGGLSRNVPGPGEAQSGKADCHEQTD